MIGSPARLAAAIERAEVAVMIVDASQPLTEQEIRTALRQIEADQTPDEGEDLPHRIAEILDELGHPGD
mgnify:CR=1 FL=1